MDKPRQDFEVLLAMKKLDGYIFTSEKNSYKPLRRYTLTKEINLILQNFLKKLPNKPYLISHSFIIGFIAQLWHDTNKIKKFKWKRNFRFSSKVSTYEEIIKLLKNRE